jgi:hypothetical protein
VEGAGPTAVPPAAEGETFAVPAPEGPPLEPEPPALVALVPAPVWPAGGVLTEVPPVDAEPEGGATASHVVASANSAAESANVRVRAELPRCTSGPTFVGRRG